MSDDAIKVRVQTPSVPNSANRAPMWRYAFYVVGAVLAVLTLAYIDGGEEPLHPIVQSSTLPAQTEVSWQMETQP